MYNDNDDNTIITLLKYVLVRLTTNLTSLYRNINNHLYIRNTKV